MSVERKKDRPQWHDQGTMDAVTRWIASHPEGVAEWMKNVRRQYRLDRANVSPEHAAAAILLRDAKDGTPARIGVLDVGGATLEDLTAWEEWQNPKASRRASTLDEEQTQGNGGKAYMCVKFSGPARILGVRDGRRNSYGMEGEPGTALRGNPGWAPSEAEGREVEISSFQAELQEALRPYGVSFSELPPRLAKALASRKAFTLVEGQGPLDLYKGRIVPDQLIGNVIRHEQATLCLEQVEFFAIHNGRLLNDGKPLQLPPITPFPGFETPVVHAVLSELPTEGGQMISTTEGGTRDPGRLILHTSAKDMRAAYKNLNPRWQLIYRTRHQMIGTKTVEEVVGATPGANYIYGTVELSALEPAYVEHGRRRPKPGPLTEALDVFVREKIKELAKEINSQRQQKLDDHALDEVHDENQKLDHAKNRYLPRSDEPGSGGRGGSGPGPGSPINRGPTTWGKLPDAIEYVMEDGGLQIGAGLTLPLRPFLELTVRDSEGLPVRAALEWSSTDKHVAAVEADGTLVAKEKGNCEVRAKVKGTEIESEPIPIRVWAVDHVLLSPRKLDIPLGTRQQITAEVTDDDGNRSTSVLLDWRHDADDQSVVRVSQRGLVTGNREGRTSITAGAKDVWARTPVEVTVIPNEEKPKRGSGFPRLLLTDRDIDPANGQTREGDPDQPALWQDPSDEIHNIWWLNLQSPEAAYAFRRRNDNLPLWRTYHTERVIDMVVQVWMEEEFSRKGESQVPDYWSGHKNAMDRHRIRIVPMMWKDMEQYVSQGSLDEGDRHDQD